MIRINSRYRRGFAARERIALLAYRFGSGVVVFDLLVGNMIAELILELARTNLQVTFVICAMPQSPIPLLCTFFKNANS